MIVHRKPLLLVVLVAVLEALSVSAAVAQTRAELEKQRDAWQRVGDIFNAMGITAGARVADVGAGEGFFTSRLATAVGPTGKVFAVDISDSKLDLLRQRLQDGGHQNVAVVKGTASDPKLPAGTLDAAVIINSYHEMPEHQAMLEAIRKALKPTGRLVIVEPISDQRRASTRDAQVAEHEIAPEHVLRDARAAGFRVAGLEDPFTNRGSQIEWMLTITPAGPPPAGTSTATTAAVAPADWRDPVVRISLDEFVRLPANDLTIIDVRNPAMFDRGHLPNAISIPLEEIESAADRLRTLQQPFITYCS